MNPQIKERIVWFDVLRGFFILLALWHHWAQDMTMWYMEFFKEHNLLNSLYASHAPMMGKQNYSDNFGYAAGLFFTPWVNQIYLMMASFNLASRTQEDFSKVWVTKLWMFAVLFLFFLGEKFIVARNLGEAFALYPLMTWMVILSIITLLYRFTGIAGVVFIFILGMSQWIIPYQPGNLEAWVQENFHPNMNFDSSPNLFIASGSFGFIFGWLYYHKPDFLGKFKWYIYLALGVLMTLIGSQFSPPFYFPKEDLYAAQNLKASTFWGTIEIIGIQIVVLTLAIMLHLKAIKPYGMKFLEWTGIYSLTIFAFHRIFFIHMWVPIITYYCAVNDKVLPNDTVFHWFSIAVYLLFCLFLIKSKMFRIVMRQ
jgi:hypothetical protein